MHAYSTQLVFLLVAQLGPDGGFPTEQPTVVRPADQSPAFGNRDPSRYRDPAPGPQHAPEADPGANTTSPAGPVHSQSSLARAEGLVEKLVRWESGVIEGNAVTLLECVQRAVTSGQQASTVNAYWELCAAIGHYQQTDHELVVLSGVAPQFEIEQSQIRAAQRSIEARRASARVDLLAAQEKLAELAQLPNETLPLPADRPFVGKYHTRLTTMHAGRAVPRQLRTVDRALPHQLKLIEQRAEAVDAHTRLSRDLAGLYQQGQVPLTTFLSATRDLSNEQTEFLQAVIRYNLEIATYSQAVVGHRLPAESLVSTLIRQPAASAPRIIRDNNVLPAAAQQTEPRARRGTPRSSTDPAGNVRPAFEPNPARQRFGPEEPTIDQPPVFDANRSYEINDNP